jgi:hypothetical protein
MKRKKSKPLRRATQAMSRRPPATAKIPRKLAKKIESMQIQIDDLGMLSATLHTKIDEICNLERRVEIAERKVIEIRAEVHALRTFEPNSGTRASTMGVISEEGRLPIDRNAVKDAGSLLKKT